jgi:hypothetical protein
MTNLAGYRTKVGDLLGSAVDSSTWTTAIIDQALRLALGELNDQIVYEADFEVQTTGYEQDLSGITALNNIVALAYPWTEGNAFSACLAQWRRIGTNKVYFEFVEPQDGETIRVRYTQLHVIEDLDSAVATTVADQHEDLVCLWAAAHACDMRIRQISENPALPRDAMNHLKAVAVVFRSRAEQILRMVPPVGPVRWGNYGL